MPRFKLVSDPNKQEVPNGAAITKILKTATRAASAEYAAKGLRQQFNKSRIGNMPESLSMVKLLDDYAKTVLLQSQRDNPWTGAYRELTSFAVLQENLAKDAQGRLSKSLTDGAVMDYAVSNSGEYIRGYALNARNEEDATASMDTLFNAWLAENGMFYENAQVYECNDDGVIKKDNHGNPIKVDGSVLRKLMDDDTRGFAAYLEQKQIPIVIRQRDFPEKVKAQTPQQAPVQPAVGTEPAAPSTAPSPDSPNEGPEGPGSSAGAGTTG